MEHKPSLILAFVLMISPWAGAQNFSMSASDLADNQVANSGVTIFAFDFADWVYGTTSTVNGVTFSGEAYGIGFSTSGFGNFALGAPPIPNMTPDLANILSIAEVGNESFGSITVNNLIEGRTYQLQLFGGLDNSAGSETLRDGSSSNLCYGGNGGGAFSIVDTFTATGPTETIDFMPNMGGMLVYNAINLREELATVPEPPTLPLLVTGGLLTLGLVKFRQIGL